MLNKYASVEIIEIPENPDRIIERAARKSRKSEENFSVNSDVRMVKGLRANGHDTPFEFASVFFRIERVTRVLSHQLVRHRIASYVQESQRYVDTNDFIVPPHIYNTGDYKSYIECVKNSFKVAEEYKKLGVPLETSRYLWPNTTTTSINMNINFRSLRNFFKLRLESHALWEIQLLSCCMYELLSKKTVLFEDLHSLYLDSSKRLNKLNIGTHLESDKNICYGFYKG